MIRLALCTLALLGFEATIQAGELDREVAPKLAVVSTTPAPSSSKAVGTELDKESPQSAFHGHGGWGHGGGWGYGGYGGFGYGGFGGGYRSGFGGFYRPYYGGFYSSFYRPYYGGFYGGFYPSYAYGLSPFSWYNRAWYW